MKGSVGTVSTFLDRMDERVIRLLSRYGILFLRVSLGLTFIWFGALKVFDVSPVAELVAGTVYWVPSALFVPFLGMWEILVGIGLLSGRLLRVTLLFFLMQMAGTFLVLLVKPEVAFQGYNLLLLTTEGEFVIKNLVLISGGLVVGSTIQSRRERREREHETRGETVAGY
ncbi:MAG: DoxX family membrane protein [Actinomycetota bacterium]|nr:DoxX family membrane protein [Rubrobacter sp.]MBA3790838.1 DoxX family membrane protein [Rubrobacter sp.]MDQ3238135.1 DoxX family membrane protein [Actinomycetota bacterium]MDQ3568008.1 DoxX family membrane protein [Actinomycetota bacterium]MDQ3658102.1 DoxX family membrane protein [Actinomycetota bacterium]